MKRKASALFLAATIGLTPAISLAHPGKTDSSGGHRDNKNKSGLGAYHYHCGNNPHHLHKDGKCPYNKKPNTQKNSNKKSTSSKKTSSSSSSSKVADNKKIQARLNKLGYNCGTPDGNMGPKTINAIKSFQKAKGLKADGLVGPATRKAMGI